MTQDYLINAFKAGKLSHAYLLAGEDAQKRRDLADQAAAYILCNTGEACGKCHGCRQVLAGTHPDLIRVTHEKPQTLSVQEVRDQVCATAGIRPFQNGRKIYIIDDAQMMNEHGQNALLKTIEEPPEYIVILLLADNEKKLLETIRSRCVILRLEEEGRAENADDDAGFLMTAREVMHDILIYRQTGKEDRIIQKERMEEIKRLAGEMDDQQIQKVMEAIDKAEKRLSMSVNPEITMSLLTDLLPIER